MSDPVQEQLIMARRNQILDAAARVFAEKGFHPTTIKDIAREAGIADGTIYNYFENKTGLLLASFERMRESILQSVDLTLLDGADLRALLKAMLRHPLASLQKDRFELFRVVVSEMLVNPELRALYSEKILAPTLAMGEAFLQQWADQHLSRRIDAGLVVRAVSGLMMGLIIEHVIGDERVREKWEHLPDLLADMLVDGVEGKLL